MNTDKPPFQHFGATPIAHLFDIQDHDITIPLNDARLCMGCNIFHTTVTCPICNKGPSYPATRWIPRMGE